MVGLPSPQPTVVCMPATTLTLLPVPGTNFRGTTPASLARGRGSEHRAQDAPTPRRPAATGCSLFLHPAKLATARVVCLKNRSARPWPSVHSRPLCLPPLAWAAAAAALCPKCRFATMHGPSARALTPLTAAVPAAARLGPAPAAAALCPVPEFKFATMRGRREMRRCGHSWPPRPSRRGPHMPDMCCCCRFHGSLLAAG